MYCPFAKYTDGSFRSCLASSCMAYNKKSATCKLIDRESLYDSRIYPLSLSDKEQDNEKD